MTTRKLVHEELLPGKQDDVFELLCTPSSIRSWWAAARAIVMANRGGMWAAAWGEAEDDPEYITAATILEYEPPRRLVLGDYRYRAKSGPLPFHADFVTTFEVIPGSDGTILRVVQDGFPLDSEADGFYEACRNGWRDTFIGIRRHLQMHSRSGTKG